MLEVESVQPDGKKTEIISRAPLESIIFDSTKDCNNNVLLNFKQEGQGLRQQLIQEPIHFFLKSSENEGQFNPLLIQAESGTVSITFHPALREDVLAGFKVG